MIKTKKTLSPLFENIVSINTIPSEAYSSIFELLYSNKEKKSLFQIPQPLEIPSFLGKTIIGFLEPTEYFLDSSGNLNIVTSEFSTDLLSEVSKRAEKHFYFEEKELWNLLLTGISSLSTLHQKNRFYKNLGLSNLFVLKTEEFSEFIFMDPEFAQFLEETQTKQTESRYFSMEELQENSILEEETEFLNDIFHLGLILLESATLISVASCYDIATSSIKSTFLAKKLEIMETRYSEELAFLVKIMLNLDKNRRPTVNELALLVKKMDCLENSKKKLDKVNVCKCCLQKIRRKKEEILEGGSENNETFEEEKKMYEENQKEWLKLQKNWNNGKRTVLKCLDNTNY